MDTILYHYITTITHIKGKVYVYLGATTGLNVGPAWTATGESASLNFGDAAATAGDVNGDGFADLVVGV